MNSTPTSKPRRPRTYESRVDLWIALLLAVAPIVAFALGLYLWIDGQHDDAMALLATGVAVLVVTLMLTYPCRYTIMEDKLRVRCGIIMYGIPFEKIVSVEKSSSLLSGPALSLRRVKVATARRKHLLSPRERDEFIAELRRAIGQANSGLPGADQN